MSTGGSLKVAPCFLCNKGYGLDDNNFLLLSSVVLFIHRFLDYLQMAKSVKVHQFMAKSSHIHTEVRHSRCTGLVLHDDNNKMPFWLTSFCMIVSRFIHISAKDTIWFFFYGWAIFNCTYTSHLLSHSSVDGHSGCFHVLAIVNSAAMNTGVHVSFVIMVLFGFMPKSGIAWSYGSSIFSF